MSNSGQIEDIKILEHLRWHVPCGLKNVTSAIFGNAPVDRICRKKIQTASSIGLSYALNT